MKLAERKQQIMEVGLELFARNGYYNTSVADIIKEIGIARGTFYRYFVDKTDLFNYILTEHINYGISILPELPFDHLLSTEELVSRITKGFSDFLSLPTSHNFVKLVVETMGSEKNLMEIVIGFKNFFIKGFSSYFILAQKKGLFTGRDPEITSFLLLALMKETFFQWAIYKDFDDLDKLISELISFILNGVGDVSDY